MKNILTIFRRDFKAYFVSPIGYIYLIVFLLISVGLYMTTFFAFPVADMRNFFGNLPIILCVFIPAITMRVWAEERKENTWEMLLTFPMKAQELVLGKFLATLGFYVLTLLATFVVPAMLFSLGHPDGGAILGGYLGSLMMGAMFLALGILISGFCKDQIVSFVISLLACFALFLLGTDFVASYIDGLHEGLGSFLSRTLGVLEHYNAFSRGVVEIVDVLYFLVWTGLFLWLNTMYVDARGRSGARVMFGTAVTLTAAIGLAFNWLIADQSIGRFDLTANKIYTVSEATKHILSSLDAPVKVAVYITPKKEMPAAMSHLEQDIIDKLDELRVASNGKLEYHTCHMNAEKGIKKAEEMWNKKEDKNAKKDEDKAIEELMWDKGVKPFAVQDMEADQVTSKLVYSTIGVQFGAHKEEFIPRVVPADLQQLEYRLISIIYKQQREKPPVVALIAPKSTIPPQLMQLYMQSGMQIPPAQDPYQYLQKWLEHEKYDVRRVEFTKDSPIPDDADTIVIVTPKNLDDRQRWEINRALVSGKSVILAVQNYEWDYRFQRGSMTVSQTQNHPGVNPLLKEYGVEVLDDILLDTHTEAINVPSGTVTDLFTGGQPVKTNTHMLYGPDAMNPDTSITNWLGSVFYLWGSALQVDEKKLKSLGLKETVLMHSTKGAWTVPADAPGDVLSNALVGPPPPKGKQYPLAVMITGQFPDVYKDKPRPAWSPKPRRPGMPPETSEKEENPKPVKPAPGKLIVIGCGIAFSDSFMQSASINNKDLILNSVDAVSLGDDLINVRAKRLVSRVIDDISDKARIGWKLMNFVIINLLIASIGIAIAMFRARARAAYAESLEKNK